MATTYTLIKGETLASNVTSYSFTSIPSTYTDLFLRMNIRLTTVGKNEYVTLRLNNSTASEYSETRLYAQSASVYSDRKSGYDRAYTLSYANGTTSTANSFSSTGIYFPSYLSSTNKSFSVANVQLDGIAASNNTVSSAELWRNTSAISSITIQPEGSGSLATNSTFYLYGIKSS